jgi:hydroxyacylglutathione hydrolase
MANDFLSSDIMPVHADWRFAAPPHPLIQPIPAFSDNYFWLLRAPGTRLAAVVDPGDSAPVLARLAKENLTLASILLTHHHADHTGGVADLCARTGAVVFGPADEPIPGVEVALRDGDVIDIFAPRTDARAPALAAHEVSAVRANLKAQVIAVPGHTRAHIAYWLSGVGDDSRPVLFCGDTLFAAGCGRVFEGTPAQMLASLDRLRQLPPDTLVYCAHEYTVSNLKFAVAAMPALPLIGDRLHEAERMRAQDLATVPSTLGIELATNPFMLVDSAAAQAAAAHRSGGPTVDRTAVFTALRDWKNNFRPT